jgi:hypothetical protein
MYVCCGSINSWVHALNMEAVVPYDVTYNNVHLAYSTYP